MDGWRAGWTEDHCGLKEAGPLDPRTRMGESMGERMSSTPSSIHPAGPAFLAQGLCSASSESRLGCLGSLTGQALTRTRAGQLGTVSFLSPALLGPLFHIKAPVIKDCFTQGFNFTSYITHVVSPKSLFSSGRGCTWRIPTEIKPEVTQGGVGLCLCGRRCAPGTDHQ